MWYNVRVKTYPDGHRQYLWADKPIKFDRLEDEKPKKKKSSGKHVERGKKNTMKRAVQQVYDIARSNYFDWFVTLTFNPKQIDSFDYNECSKAIRLFTKRLQRLGCQWLIVPEQHESGRYHFHGLVAGDLPLIPSGHKSYNQETGEALDIFNLANYEFGFTTATRIAHPEKTASYITKYLTKKITVPKGRKCYWASGSLARPDVDYLKTFEDRVLLDYETGEVHYIREHESDWAFGVPDGVRYEKQIENEYGRFIISEE